MKLKCIIVDDEPRAIEVLADYVKQLSTLDLLATFRNPIEALDYLRQTTVDVIFLDINMPNLGRFGFLKKFAEVRKELGLESCVIMMYSSSERQEDKENAYQFDFVKDYIVKGELTSEDLKRKLTPFC